MALINCPECGKEISEKAKSCPHCGCPIEASEPEKVENTSNYVTIHGYEETFAVDTNVKIYRNGELVGEVAPASEFKLPVDDDCELEFKSSTEFSMNFMQHSFKRSRKVSIRKGIDTHVFLSFDRFTGSLKAFVANDSNTEVVKNMKDHNASKALLNSILLIVILAIICFLIKYYFQ